ncbi:MAG: NUDIX domain-containing protein [Pirellulales bacterium]|nr:NUDIX domain-containing protein [Pirellulales bacterium]
MKRAAGLLIYRCVQQQLEVLLVHPSGNYNRHAPWSLPKGLLDEGESLIDAAIRETHEEAGVNGVTAEQLTPLGHVDYTRSNKRVYAFAVVSPTDAAPHPNCWEIEKVEFVPVEVARQRLHRDQRPFLDRLIELLGGSNREA